MTETTPAVQNASQTLDPGVLVALYTVDVSPLGVPQSWHFTNGPSVKFRGVTYASADVEATGFEWNGQGALPKPKISVSNATRLLSGLTKQYQDLVGARLIRLRTYAHHLDGASQANPDEIFAADVYNFEQKVAHDKLKIEWSLSASMDQQGRNLPGRRVLRDVCMWRYRRWTGARFDYTKATCPYNGPAYFNAKGEPTSIDKDSCGKLQSDCKKRYGEHAELPFGGFPGITRLRL